MRWLYGTYKRQKESEVNTMDVKLKDDLTNEQRRCALYIINDLEALNWLDKTSADYTKAFSAPTLLNDEEIHTSARALDDFDFFKNPSDVIDYYEKPHNYIQQVAMANFYSHAVSMCVDDKTLTSGDKLHIRVWLNDYKSNVGLEIAEKIAELEDDLTLYT